MSFSKRYQKELYLLYNQQIDKNLNYSIEVNSFSEDSVVIYMELIGKILLELEIQITKYFPFGKPTLKINNIDYIEYLHIDPKFYDKFNINICPCCSSILCSNNWGCSYKFIDIIDEVYKNFSFKIRIMQLRYCKKIVDKYFGFYVPIDEFI